MTKLEFKLELSKKLEAISKNDRNKAIDFYTELIDDRMEDGMSEAEAICALGDLDEIAAQIKSEASVKGKIKKRNGLTTVLLIVGSPIWLALAIAAAAVLFAVFVVLWSLVITLMAVDVSFAACALAGFIVSPFSLVLGNGPAALLLLGAGLILAGLSILLFLAITPIMKGFIALHKKTARRIILKITGRETV